MVFVALRIINIIHSGFISECWLFLHFHNSKSRNLQRKKKLTGCTSFWERFHIFSGCFRAIYIFLDLQKVSMFAKAFLAASILPLPPLAFSLSDTLLDKFGPKKMKEIHFQICATKLKASFPKMQIPCFDTALFLKKSLVQTRTISAKG